MNGTNGGRHAFRMQLKPGCLPEYKAAHNAIWPELADLLHDAGIRDYSIFHDPMSNALFAVLSIEGEDGRAELPDHPIMQKWWDAMAPLMDTNADKSPVAIDLTEVFFLT